MISGRPAPEEPLSRDLALVLPAVRRVDRVTMEASIAGRRAERAAAVAEAAGHLSRSVAPAFVGLGHLSIEAVREVVALAEMLGARLLPDRPVDPTASRRGVVRSATLGHVFGADRLLWVGDGADQGPVAAAIAGRNIVAEQLAGDLPTVLARRRAWGDAPGELPDVLRGAARPVALLAAACDERVVAQWHHLAADVQRRTRLSVLVLPHPLAPPDHAGAASVVTWQTGLAFGPTGVDFGDGAPRPCPAGAAAGSVDVVLDASGGTWPAPCRIAVGRRVDDRADVAFVGPGLGIGLAARVMRFDGVVLWLCDDPDTAPADPTVALFAALRRTCEDQ